MEFLVLEADASEAADVGAEWIASGLTVRTVRGRKMRGLQGLFDEFAAALQFPWYFGENGAAFDECLTDLSWLPPHAGYVLVVADPGEVLVDDDDDGGLAWLIDSLTRANAVWSTPIESGEWCDRPAVPFHVVLQSATADVSAVRFRWHSAGAVVSTFG